MITQHNKTPAEIGREDALRAVHGEAITNPFPYDHPDQPKWHQAFADECVRLMSEEAGAVAA